MTQKTLYEQLRNSKKQKTTFKKEKHLHKYMLPYRDVMSLIEDGVDHINIWAGATTDLGSVLDHCGPLELDHRIFGYFDNMNSFWHFIQSVERDDRIRNMKPGAAYKFSKMLTVAKVTNFKAIIADSNWQRIKSKPALINLIKHSDLPFDCYRIDRKTGMRTRPPFFAWLLWSFEEMRTAIKENRKPDFSDLLDVKGSDIYEFVMYKQQAVVADQPVVKTPVAEAPVVDNTDQ